MKKLKLLLALPLLYLILLPSLSEAFDFDSFGAKVALVMPEGPIDNAMGFGVIAIFGSIFRQIPSLKAETDLDYWGKSYESFGSTIDFISLSLNGTAKYYFTKEGISPFAGTGIDLIYSRSSFEVKEIPGFEKASTSETDFGFHFCGGVDIPVGNYAKITAEARYTKSEGDTFQLIGAFVIDLK